MSKKYFEFGEVIPGLKIYGEDAPYPVLDEREVRAGAGIMLAIGTIAFTRALLLGSFGMLKYVVVLFFVDFLIRVLFGVKLSPVFFVARLFIAGQQPEWVGAVQKRFAWSLGVMLAGTMTLLLWVFDVRGVVNLTICIICLTFMWLESCCGICVGCKMYYGLVKLGVIKAPDYRPACPGGVCSIDKK